MQPHAVLQGPPNTTKRGKKVPNKKGDEEDEEDDVEIVELKTKFLVCSRCNFRVHWRCYESPFIKKPVSDVVGAKRPSSGISFRGSLDFKHCV